MDADGDIEMRTSAVEEDETEMKSEDTNNGSSDAELSVAEEHAQLLAAFAKNVEDYHRRRAQTTSSAASTTSMLRELERQQRRLVAQTKQDVMDLPLEPTNATLEAAKDANLFRFQLLEAGYVWSTSSGKSLVRLLPNFSYTGMNTVVIHGVMTEASRFAVNITGKEGLVTSNVYYHFNPRLDKKTIIQNARVDERWQAGTKEFPREFPFSVNTPFFVRITIYEKGFAVYIDGQFFTQFPHAVPLPNGQEIAVQLSHAGDYGENCSLTCDGMWWGHFMHTHVERPVHVAKHHEPSKTVLVRNVHASISLEELGPHFDRIGTVEDIVLENGIGKVTFVDIASSEKAIQTMNGFMLANQAISVEYARK